MAFEVRRPSRIKLVEPLLTGGKRTERIGRLTAELEELRAAALAFEDDMAKVFADAFAAAENRALLREIPVLSGDVIVAPPILALPVPTPPIPGIVRISQ